MMDHWTPQLILILVAIFFTLVYYLSPILTPFIISALLAYLTNPIVKRLTRWHVPHTISAVIVFVSLFTIIIALILLVIPMIERQLITFIEFAPRMLEWVQSSVSQLIEFFNIHDINTDFIKTTFANQVSAANTVASWLGKTAVSSGLALAAFVTNLVLIPVVTFYLLRDWNQLLKNIQQLLPRAIEPTITHLAKECDLVLGQFIRGQLLVMLALGILYSIGLSLIGLNVGIIIGMISGLACVVPYLGFIIGVTSASIAAFIQFNTWTSVALVFAVFIGAQSIDAMFLTPNLIGHRVGLHPVAVIFSVLAGGVLFGFVGVLLALPVASVLMVLARFATSKYQRSGLYKSK